jgi:hypothetical protein
VGVEEGGRGSACATSVLDNRVLERVLRLLSTNRTRKRRERNKAKFSSCVSIVFLRIFFFKIKFKLSFNNYTLF